MENVILGLNDHLILHLERSIAGASRIRFIVSFIMESGAKIVAAQLKDAAQRGVKIEILTGTYMGITEPSAIYYLWNVLGDSVDIRFYSDHMRAFHPKTYIFNGASGGEIYIGSSNLSHSALTNGVEWNYRIRENTAPKDFKTFEIAFDELFKYRAVHVDDKALKEYAQSWKKPALFNSESGGLSTGTIEPKGPQIEALYELKLARDEGLKRGLVIAATGVGKTYIGAFDSIYHRRVLYIAHREEILKQAKESFRKIRPKSRYAEQLNARPEEADVHFSTIQTISKMRRLKEFPKDYFDYVIVDEFHHAAADSYLKVIDYFEPRFLLGLTATPFRTDNKDIFVLCDDNVVYEINLKEAINRDILSPFSYYGVFDETDYSNVEVRKGKYVTEQLEKVLIRRDRFDLILSHFIKFNGLNRVSMGFCASIRHAELMAEYFNSNGVKAVCVHSRPSESKCFAERGEAIEALKSRSVQIVFSVDVFNEGVDVPALDMVLFLRPTESFTLFLQQLGRGLRKSDYKEKLIALDFIGNYRKAHYIPSLLAGRNPLIEARQKDFAGEGLKYPEQCTVNFDFRLLDLFKTLSKNDPLKERMRSEFERIGETLKRRPTRREVYEASDIPFREYLKNGWLRFLETVKALAEDESAWLGTPAEGFLKELEKTHMTKAYKMPTIEAFIREDGAIKKSVDLREVGARMKNFYNRKPYYKRDLDDKSNRGWQDWNIDQFGRLAKRNPIHFLSKSKYFHFDEINGVFYLDDSLEDYLDSELAAHVRDILDYKTVNFFRKKYLEDE